jgi:hypothetical protein
VTPEQYRQKQAALAQESQRKVAVASALFLGGSMLAGATLRDNVEDFLATASLSIAAMNAASVALADTFLSLSVNVPAIGLGAPDDDERRIQLALNRRAEGRAR